MKFIIFWALKVSCNITMIFLFSTTLSFNVFRLLINSLNKYVWYKCIPGDLPMPSPCRAFHAYLNGLGNLMTEPVELWFGFGSQQMTISGTNYFHMKSLKKHAFEMFKEVNDMHMSVDI